MGANQSAHTTTAARGRPGTTPATPLLERSAQLRALREAWTGVQAGHGGVLVLLDGEAGAGKTTLLRQFGGEVSPPGRVLWGGCDPLFTPRPLGPLVDLAHELGGELRDLIADGAKPHQLAAALVREAQARPGPVVVLEDLHWADEATLDVLSLLGRRITSIPAMVVVTYRDDELDRAHPLRRLLGELRTPHGAGSVRRLTADPLSVAAVDALAAPHGLDGIALYRATAGNPFFVTEVLAADGDDIPRTVRDAVLARAGRLSDAAGRVLEAVSIALPQAELWLLDGLVEDAAEALAECLGAGMLQVAGGGIAFRHELARIAVEDSLSPHRRLDLHRRALLALTDPPIGRPDLARLAHHAEASGDGPAVLRFAPAAAEHAASIGAHREAAGQYARALRFGETLPPAVRASLLEGRSYECFLTDQAEASVEALEAAVECRRTIGDRRGEGAALSLLSRRLWCGGHGEEAWRAGRVALELLETLPPGPELALAYSNLSQLCLNDEDVAGTMTWGIRALDLAEQFGDTSVIVHSLNNIGTIELLTGHAEGRAKLERSLALSEQAGLEEHIGRAYIHIGWLLSRTRAAEFGPMLDRGVQVCEELGLETWKLYLLAYRARYHLDRGRWTEAAEDAGAVLRSAESAPLLLILSLTVIGLVRARRGDPDQWLVLDEALALVDGQSVLQYLAPVAAARAEAAWLEGRPCDVDEATRDVLAAATARGAAGVVGELTWLRHLAGLPTEAADAAGLHTAQLAGDLGAAVDDWTRLGCPYDAALALVAAADEESLRQALAQFQELGARPAAAIVARRLREHGVRGLPRGPRPTTRAHPASLTRRESEVLALVQVGSSNAEIAARLFLAEKTVHHHVSAILRKLGVGSRSQAASVALTRGLSGTAPRPS